MSDANGGPEPLPVIPADDPGLFTAAPLSAQPVIPERKGLPLVAWLLIAFCVYLRVNAQFKAGNEEDRVGQASVGVKTLKMQAKVIIGTKNLVGSASLTSQIRALNTGPIDQRLRFIVLSGEVSGPEEALNDLADLEKRLKADHIEPTKTQAELMKILRKLYEDYKNKRLDAPSLTPRERELLRKELDWFGELALAPSGGPDTAARARILDSVNKTLIGYYCALGVGGLLAICGFVALIIFLVFLLRGKLQRGIRAGVYHGGLYAETFALWMIVFEVFSWVGGHAARQRWIPAGGLGFAIYLAGEVLTLTVLAWLVLRGIPWRQVRWEIGLKAGRRPFLEPFVGLAGNIMALPLLVLGVLITLLLLIFRSHLHGAISPLDDFGGPNLPSHPIVQELPGASWIQLLQILILASVVAPIVEETMFRGVLYRHLREATDRLGYGWSVLVSALISSFIFAVIHPQGFLGVPPLMALAFMFCLLREWRGSLVPGMVAHGLNNGLVLMLGITILGN